MSDPFYSPKQDRHLRLVPEEDLLLARKRIAALQAQVKQLQEALAGVLPYMEQCEAAVLMGDEGCHWPVELVRAALAATEPKP